MRIRRRPLPFPPLLPSPLLHSDPSPPKPQSIKESSLVQLQDQQVQQEDQKGLHQDGDLHQTDPPRLGGAKANSSSSKGVVRVLHPFLSHKFEVKVSEEEKSVECKRIATSTSSIDDSNALIKEEKGKDKKKPKRSQAEAMLLEGSRCSRINGRGWRCAQPTLVGYSLCEHHLGKGRSRGPSIAPRGPLGCTEHKKKQLGEGSFHEIVPRKKNKARSISSLLDEKANGDNLLISNAMKNGDGV